jgi:7-carboxy-7-deazaguanine synthase
VNSGRDAETLAVAEIFGPTFQGEGPSTGQIAMFLRLMRCNLDCDWCDTPYTWDRDRFDLAAETTRVPVADAAVRLLAEDTPLVVITGGEPLLQTAAVADLTRRLVAEGRRVEIETNGTIAPTPELLELAWWNVSPKLRHSKILKGRRIKRGALSTFVASGRAVFKFVVQERGDLTEIDDLVDRYGLDPVWVMPEGTSTTVILDRMRVLADAVLARGYRLSPRLHVLLWEDTRGR